MKTANKLYQFRLNTSGKISGFSFPDSSLYCLHKSSTSSALHNPKTFSQKHRELERIHNGLVMVNLNQNKPKSTRTVRSGRSYTFVERRQCGVSVVCKSVSSQSAISHKYVVTSRLRQNNNIIDINLVYPF